MLPEPLALAIDRATASVPQRVLRRAAATLSERYRSESRRALDREEHLAYVATRLPATYAAVAQVLGVAREVLPDLAPGSLLDLGAGPGTVLWAATEILGPFSEATLVERDRGFTALGRELLTAGRFRTAVTWSARDLTERPALAPHDLVVAAFSVGEAAATGVDDAIASAWDATRHALVVIEPGTAAGFATVLRVRAGLVALGARLVAPCPHDARCPVSPPDVCHFAARLARTRLHRQTKGAVRGFEDEKFSYIVAAKAGAPAAARVVRRPEVRKGHLRLRLCTTDGLIDRTVSRREGEAYRTARRLRWGDAWNEPHGSGRSSRPSDPTTDETGADQNRERPASGPAAREPGDARE